MLFSANSAIFQQNHGENKLPLNKMIMRSTLYQTNMPSLVFLVPAHRNNSPQTDMSPQSDTLSLFFLLNAVYLVENQQIPTQGFHLKPVAAEIRHLHSTLPPATFYVSRIKNVSSHNKLGLLYKRALLISNLSIIYFDLQN